MSDTVKIILFAGIYLVSVLISSVSQIMLKKSANKIYENKIREYLNPLVIIAYAMFFGSMVMTMIAYKGIDQSMGPVLEASGYIFVAVLGYIFLKERFTKKKLIGMGLIIVGIAVFSLGKLPAFK